MPFHEIEVFAMREKILVLEDDDNLRQLVVESLEDMNQSFQIVDVHRPELAIDAARHTRFDLMLTDVRMAGFTDGLGALEEVKKHCPNIYSIRGIKTLGCIRGSIRSRICPSAASGIALRTICIIV